MRRLAKLLLAAATLAVSLVLGASPASGMANPNASCLGIGGSTETALFGAGARADIAHEVNQIAQDTGSTPGETYAFFAHEHLGSVGACFG